MPYRYLEDVAIADVAIEAWGPDAETLFTHTSDATLNVMVQDLDTVTARVERSVALESGAFDMLLFNYLQETIFYKDAQRLLLRTKELKLTQTEEKFTLDAVMAGEELDMQRHELVVDVKAVTLHQFRVEKTERVWKAFVILDI